jgi:hypothetical protein
MEMLDLNHTLLLVVVLFASATRLVQLLFACLKICVREYYAFRVWRRLLMRSAQRLEREISRT